MVPSDEGEEPEALARAWGDTEEGRIFFEDSRKGEEFESTDEAFNGELRISLWFPGELGWPREEEGLDELGLVGDEVGDTDLVDPKISSTKKLLENGFLGTALKAEL